MPAHEPTDVNFSIRDGAVRISMGHMLNIDLTAEEARYWAEALALQADVLDGKEVDGMLQVSAETSVPRTGYEDPGWDDEARSTTLGIDR